MQMFNITKIYECYVSLNFLTAHSVSHKDLFSL